jgi:signal transduction histidine kinase
MASHGSRPDLPADATLETAAFARRIRSSVWLVVVSLVVTSVFALFALWRIMSIVDLAIAERAEGLLLVQQLQLHFERSVAANRAFMLTGREHFDDTAEEADAAFAGTVEVLRGMARTHKGRLLLEMSARAKHDHATAASHAMDAARTLGTADVLREFESRVLPETREVTARIDALSRHKRTRLDETTAQSERWSRLSLWALLLVTLANTLAGAAVILVVRRTLRRVHRYARQLNHAIRMRDEFLGVAGHELRTPLSVLGMSAQLLQRAVADGGVPDPRMLGTLAARLDRNVAAVATLVDRMLDVANLNEGRLQLSRAPCNLADIARQAVDRMGPLCEQAGCPVVLEVVASPDGQWDRTRLDQVICNLLVNVTRHACRGPARMTVDRNGDSARLTLVDQGPGVADADRLRIFERFERLGAPKDGSGMGLGLAVARDIVLAHGGRLWVDSAPGGGARFIMELPIGN